jgi:hypothetical protein
MEDSSDLNGPVILVVLLCLAVALMYINFGLGVLNLATDNRLDPPRTVTTKSPGSAPVQSVGLAEQMRLLKEEVRAQNRELVRSRKQLEAHGLEIERAQSNFRTGKQRLDEMQRQAAGLNSEVGALQRSLILKAGSFPQLAAMEHKLAEARSALASLDQSNEELRRSLQEKRTVRTGEGRKGSQRSLLVECNATGIVVLPEGRRIAFADIEKDPFLPSSFHQAMILFLIRPTGFASFEVIRGVAEKYRALGVGYEPIDEDWLLQY